MFSAGHPSADNLVPEAVKKTKILIFLIISAHYRKASEDWSVASLMSCPKHNPHTQDMSNDTLPTSEK